MKPGILTQKDVDLIFQMYESGETMLAISKKLCIDRKTIWYRIKKDNRIGTAVEREIIPKKKKSRTFTLPKREVFLRILSCKEANHGKKCYKDYLEASNQVKWQKFLSECERKKENRKQNII